MIIYSGQRHDWDPASNPAHRFNLSFSASSPEGPAVSDRFFVAGAVRG